jgi:hypothetical protein
MPIPRHLTEMMDPRLCCVCRRSCWCFLSLVAFLQLLSSGVVCRRWFLVLSCWLLFWFFVFNMLFLCCVLLEFLVAVLVIVALLVVVVFVRLMFD